MTKPARKSDYETLGWISRQDAARLLGVAELTLLRWEKSGLLHGKRRPMHGDNGLEIVVYNPKELAARCGLRRKKIEQLSPGMLAAHVFALFDAGESLRTIVVKTAQTPATIEGLYAQWKKFADLDSQRQDDFKTIDAAIETGAPDVEIETAINLALDESAESAKVA